MRENMVIAVTNQKGGVGNGKKKIMESPTSKVLANKPKISEELSIMCGNYLPRLLSQSIKSEFLCQTVFSGSGEGLGYASMSASRLNRSSARA